MSDYSLTQIDVTAFGIRISATRDQGIEIGHVFVYFIPHEARQKPYALLEDLFVSESERGQGTGTVLLEAAIAVAKEHGCYKIIGTSRFSRETVHAWYVRKGFERFGYEFRMNLD